MGMGRRVGRGAGSSDRARTHGVVTVRVEGTTARGEAAAGTKRAGRERGVTDSDWARRLVTRAEYEEEGHRVTLRRFYGPPKENG